MANIKMRSTAKFDHAKVEPFLRAGWSLRQIAREFKVSYQAINQIKRKKTDLPKGRIVGIVFAIVFIGGLLQGCIPLMIGGYIGYQMSQNDAHAQFCVQHVGDASCHP